jgi:hypothetical protein
MLLEDFAIILRTHGGQQADNQALLSIANSTDAFLRNQELGAFFAGGNIAWQTAPAFRAHD